MTTTQHAGGQHSPQQIAAAAIKSAQAAAQKASPSNSEDKTRADEERRP